ncbi:NitT/TauT family transport system substrate-binding protein [Alkalispirillum mobile]|uniref:NitT/TauT family transport system substrate-binding protein n=1 Tax=Alkalispirillum mobile TaxID=85925 RepID=A0A498CEW1_9GAMM|nr:ABC transporter substrate-binding protein [Alkalispirillum mobile]RLK50958.1 NitT/TauT family transport system substrate-binding protein [Alkalispirillum mobile]
MAKCEHDGDSHIDYDFSNGRRRFLLDSLAAGGLAAGLGMPGLLSTAAAASKDEVVRIGYLPITDATPLLVAHARGYFEDEGLEVADPELIRGWSPLVEGFARGRYNLVHLLKPIPVWMRYNNHFPVKIMAWAHTNGSAVLMSQASGAKEFADLGGTQIAVPFWYSVHNVLLQMALREAGLEPVIQDQSAELADNQVNLAILPPAEMPSALAAGRIDGFTVAEPFNAAGELLANGSLLRFTGDIWKNHPCCVLCMNEKQVEANPERTQKVLNALVRAELYAQQNKVETAEMLSRDGKGYLPMPANVVVRAMTHYDPEEYADPRAIRHSEWGVGRIDFAPYPYPSATRELVRNMTQTLVGGDKTFLDDLDPDRVAADLVDDRFVRRALEQYPEAHQGDVTADTAWEREEIIRL